MSHIEELEARIKRFEAQLLQGLSHERGLIELLQTLPGVDCVGAAMLLVEIYPFKMKKQHPALENYH